MNTTQKITVKIPTAVREAIETYGKRRDVTRGRLRAWALKQMENAVAPADIRDEAKRIVTAGLEDLFGEDQ